MAARQRKLTNIDLTEVSGVSAPAHLVEGWVIQKAAAEGSDLPVGAFPLKPHEEALAAPILRGVQNGQMIDFEEAGKGARIGKSASGVAFISTPASIAKAAGNEWAKEHGVGQLPSQRS